jgi:rare lipoprotein A
LDYRERGVASWYGPGFHKVRTSTGEPYDMYGMTAAHKTLPLPAYVRVTNLQNGRSVVVRVNDRGPFVGNRIIDLSYTAAAKLDMLRNGTAMVEVRSIDPSAPAPAVVPVALPAANPAAAPASASTSAPTTSAATTGAAPAPGTLFVQAGAFSDPANAERLAAKLRSGSYGKVFVRDDQIAGRRMYRVRIGPVPNVAGFDRVVAALEQAGITDAHLALD